MVVVSGGRSGNGSRSTKVKVKPNIKDNNKIKNSPSRKNVKNNGTKASPSKTPKKVTTTTTPTKNGLVDNKKKTKKIIVEAQTPKTTTTPKKTPTSNGKNGTPEAKKLSSKEKPIAKSRAASPAININNNNATASSSTSGGTKKIVPSSSNCANINNSNNNNSSVSSIPISSLALISTTASTEIMVTSSTNGPRIQAQRKFAQSGNIYTGTLHLNHSKQLNSQSPYSTPSKELKRSQDGNTVFGNGGSSSSKKVKKPMFSPPPCKRPKTVDFLTFLCVRGTPTEPPELSFFNSPQVFEPEVQTAPKKKLFSQTGAQTSFETKESVGVAKKYDNHTQPSIKTNGKAKESSKYNQQKAIANAKIMVKKKSTSSSKISKSNASVSSSSISSCKAENPTKGIRATASSVLLSKFNKKISPVTSKTRPVLSPPRSRSRSNINEKDAKFAMRALTFNLKYQRLTGKKRSAMLTKKAKESIILTRSKSRSPLVQSKLSPKRGKFAQRFSKPVIISPSRNAPSPDIIFGVTSSVLAARKRASKSSSDEAESDSEEEESQDEEDNEHSEQSDSSSGNSSDANTPPKRSLRNGKELTRPKSKSPKKLSDKELRKLKKKREQSIEENERRVGTRAAHRISKSPLREMPMWNLKTKQMKRMKNRGKNKDSIKKKKKMDDNEKHSPSKRIEKTEDGKRPSRKTKETAANLLGLLTHGFSTDDEDSADAGKRVHDEDSDLGSSSSSETKFLEKHYNAALRREEEKYMENKKGSSSDVKKRLSKRDLAKRKNDNDKKANSSSSKRLLARKLRSKKSSSEEEEEEEEGDEEEEISLKSPSKSDKRRDTTTFNSSNKKKGTGRESPTKSRSRLGTPTVGDRKMAGAVRKSASITCGRKSRYSSSEEDNSDSDDQQSDDNKNSPKKSTRKTVVTKKKVTQAKESDSSDDDAEDEESEEEEEQEKSQKQSASTKKPKPQIKKANKKPTNKRQNKKKSSDDDEESSESDSDASNKSTTRNMEREESVETEHCSVTSSPPASRSSILKSATAENESSESEDDEVENQVASSSGEEESVEEEEEEEDDPDSTIVKVDMSTQVDMDEEEGKLPAESMVLKDPEVQGNNCKDSLRVEMDDTSDDEIQEIGQVFASSSTSTSAASSRRPSTSKQSLSPSGYGSSTSSTASSTIPPFSHRHHESPPSMPHHQFQPHHHHHHLDPTLDPLHNNPFSPFALPPPRPDFYTPLQLNPPMVHSSIQLVGSSLGAPSFPVANPLNTLSIPVSVPFSSHHLLPHHPSTLGFATGSTFHSTTLQTHIRSVATNLDIPLVRPVVGNIGSEHHHHFMSGGRGPSIGISSSTPLTRPTIWGQTHLDAAASSRSHHFSAFRVPHVGGATHTHTSHTTQHVIHHQSTTVLGMNSTPILPVSIIQPQQQHHQLNYHQQHQQQQQQQNYHQQPSSSKGSKSSSSSSSSCKNASSNNTSSTGNVSSSSSTTPKTPKPAGYNLIKHLPNVSIVPKFDRKAEPAACILSCGKTSSKDPQKESDTKTEKKKAGRKKKESVILPQPSSPLTVKKDTNPTTYATKKQQKERRGSETSTLNDSKKGAKQSKKKEQSSEQGSSSHKQEPQHDKPATVKKKKESSSSSPIPSCSTSSNVLKREKSESPLLSKIKKESAPEPNCSSKSSNPPSRTSSPNIQSVKAKSGKTVAGNAETSHSTNLEGIKDAPTFYPSDKEFEDPLKYIQSIQAKAEHFGMARIVPPKSFRPECNVEDDMRFTAYNHYIHKMFQRWGPIVSECVTIRENIKQSQVDSSDIPIIGGMEINLATLYQTVKSFGGLKEVIEKQKWTKVADTMYVPKAAHDRAAKLDAIYVKYVLPYEILSDGEREKLKKKVEKKWAKRKQKMIAAAENVEDEPEEDSMDELDECIVKGKTTPLGTYFRVARNTSNIFFPPEKQHSTDDIEEEYWKIVREKSRHVCVYSGSIDCAGVGWGFPIPKSSNKHPWNLKVLANNQGSVLRSMGPVMGATVPTLHVAMIFTSYCWYRDPHSLPWLEYLHSGAKKVWYSVAGANEAKFRSTLTELMPMQCKKKKIWLASDSAMVPPELLISKGVPLVRAVQNAGEFLVVFPKAYTSAICTGYLISESVCFAYPSWLKSCLETFKDIKESKEPPVFPLEKLLLSILQDARASLEVVRMALPTTKEIIKEEMALRKKISSLGVKYGGKMTTDSESSSTSKSSAKKKATSNEEEIEQCYTCNYSLYLTLVKNAKTDSSMCLKHAIEHLSKHKADIKKSIIQYDMDEEQLSTLVENASKRCGNAKS